MRSLMLFMGSPVAPYVMFLAACVAAWKAADFLEAENLLAAVAAGAVCAFFGPLAFGDLIAGALAGMADPDAPERHFFMMPIMGLNFSRIAFALAGVVLWCGFERTA